MRLLSALVVLLLAIPGQASAATPVATVAVVFNRASIRPVTAHDPVRIASISKLVTALGVMRLVDQGKLDLDRDVSGYLGFPLRNPAFPDRRITLRRLLSHQSSLRDGDDLYIMPLGVTLRQRLGDPAVWDPDHAPGSGWFHYTNLNFPLVASVMERVTGERFDVLMSRLVLRPLKLDACFNWGAGCSADAFRKAVVLYRDSGEVARDDLHGNPPACPVVVRAGQACDLAAYRPGDNGALFSPQGGLRVSLIDLARIGQVLAKRGAGFLSPRSFAELTGLEWRFNGHNGLGEDGTASGFFCGYGLALHRIGAGGTGCRDDLFTDGRSRIGHAGDAYGLKSGLWVDPVTGRGIAYFTTAVAPDAPTGRSAFSAAEEALVERAEAPPFR